MPKKRKGSNQWAHAHAKKNAASSSQVTILQTPAISEINAPEGYLAVSMSQAMMNYAKPIMEYFFKGVVKDMNTAFGIAMRLWNYTIDIERSGGDKERNSIISTISRTLKLNRQGSIELFDSMVQRKGMLLPSDIQPVGSRIMYIKKEKSLPIPGFDYASLNVSELVLPADAEDRDFLDMLDDMDTFVTEDVDYDAWEDFYLELQDVCKSRFGHWLHGKGVQKYYEEEFPYCTDIFLDFIYRYGHDSLTTLNFVKRIYFKEFFFDHILRKVSMEPPEYVLFPPAIKSFYRFLAEKEYVEDPESIIGSIDDLEPDFVRMLKKRFE